MKEKVALVAVLLLSVALRLVYFPGRYEVRDYDECGYLESSLNLLEGLTPKTKPSPAGTQTWLGWCYTAAIWVKRTALPSAGAPEAAVPVQLRPFVALDGVLWDQYRDMSGLRTFELVAFCGLAVWATAAGFALGRRRAGLAGAVLVGTLAAATPLVVEFSLMARSYSPAWSFGILALAAADRGRGRADATRAGLLFGLAVASRIEMLSLLPVVWWEAASAKAPDGWSAWRSVRRITGVAAVTTLVVAPWLVTNLIGNLRAIATIRFSDPPPGVSLSAGATLGAILWRNAMLVPAVLLLAVPLWGRHRWRSGLVLVVIVAGLTLSTLRGGFGLHQNGPAFVALIASSAAGLAAVTARWPRLAWPVCAAGGLLVMSQAAAHIVRERGRLPANESTQWVEAHVPPGTTVYTPSGTLRRLVPTPESAAAIWGEVNAADAYLRKFGAGLKRFGLSADAVPRALSDENMLQERAHGRPAFILGNPLHHPEVPRYRVVWTFQSGIFFEQDPVAAYRRTGGVLIWNTAIAPLPDGLGEPVAALPHRQGGERILIYCSPDVMLNDVPARPTTPAR